MLQRQLSFRILLALSFSFPLFAQWGEDPFIYVAPKLEKKVVSTKANRKPASLDVQVKEVDTTEQDQGKLDKDVAKQVIQESSVPDKKEEPVKKPADKDEAWERLKNNFVEGKQIEEQVVVSSAPKKKDYQDIYIRFSVGGMSYRADSSYYPRALDADSILYRLDFGVNFSRSLQIYVQYDSSSKFIQGDNPNGSTSTNFNYIWTELGLRINEFSNSDSALDWVVGLRETQLAMAGSSDYKLGAKTSSLVLGLDYRWGTTNKSYYLLKARLYPRAEQSEEISSWTSKSGNDPEVISADLGFQYSRFLRKSFRLDFQTKLFFEQVQFTGTSEAADPSSSQSITDTDVKTIIKQFGIGFTWEY